MTVFLGMRGTGDWVTDQRPMNWRKMMLRLYPNGKLPLTAITSMLPGDTTDDPQFHWWTKNLPTQGGAITGVYTDVLLSSAYVSGGTAGQTLYVKMAEATADEFRAGHLVLMRDSSDITVDCVGKVSDVVKNGASSYLAVKLLEADDNSSSGDLSDADRALIIGNLNAEGGPMPDAIAYDPTKHYNYTQIWRNSLSITRTAKMTNLRTNPQAYQEAKRECLELHGLEIEKSLLWSIATENVGANKKKERTTQGLIPFIKSEASDNVFDYASDTDYSGYTWLQGGEDWLDTRLEQIFRYGRTEKMGLAGSGAVLAINKLAKNVGQWSFTKESAAYGIQIMQWVTPFGILNLKTHPLFSFEETNRNSIVVFEPENLRWRYITDTTFYKEGEQQNTGAGRTDSTEEEYLTEAGLEFHHPLTCGMFTNVGSDNSV